MAGAAPGDVLGFLPAPASQPASEMLGGELFAYASAGSIVVVDVRAMQVATVLVGLHRGAVTAVSWCPDRPAGRDLRKPGGLRLAGGDSEGRVVVWDVHSSTGVAGLDDPWLAATGRRAEGGRSPVRALAWVGATPSLLAVALNGLFLVWDSPGGAVVWRKALAPDLGVASIPVDPCDRRRLCLCGERGSLMVLRLVDVATDRVESQTYKVDVSGGGGGGKGGGQQHSLRCLFAAAQDLLFVVLARELAVFDLEHGLPAASSSLPSGRPPFRDVLGGFGHASLGADCGQPGIDTLFCSHQGGGISRWQRCEGQLTYALAAFHPLLPPPGRLNGNQPPALVALGAAPWRREAEPQPQEPQESAPREGREAGGSAAPEDGGERPQGLAQPRTSLLAVCVTTDGKVWQWDLPADSQPRQPSKQVVPDPTGLRPARPAPPPPPRSGSPARPAPASGGGGPAELLGLLQCLPAAVTTLSACPTPVAVGASLAVPVLAAVTAGGSIELVSLQQGALQPLQPAVSASMGAHRDLVRGVRWLGASCRLASFASERQGAGFRNQLLLTDVRSRASLAVREVAAESAPMLGIRASPGGRYLLLLLRGAPSEIWQVGGPGRPSRLRVLDLPFTAVEWVLPGEAGGAAQPMPAPGAAPWQRSPLAKERSLGGYSWDGSEEGGEEAGEQPEEQLAFALGDGRVGVLSVRGKKVTDTKPRRPQWGPAGAAAESLPTAIAAWGPLVVLGHEDGSLSRWDTRSGGTHSLATGQGTVRRLHFAAPASGELSPGAAQPIPANARLAALFGGGTCGVWELDAANELRASAFTPASAARLGKVIDLSWAPLPPPVGPGSVLALATEDGALAFVDAVHTAAEQPSQRRRAAAFRALLAGAVPGVGECRLPPARPLGSALLLPTCWRLLLKLLLQRGVPAPLLRACCAGGGGGRAADEALWARLPPGVRAGWEQAAPRLSSAEAGELRALAADAEVRGFVRRRSRATADAPTPARASPAEAARDLAATPAAVADAGDFEDVERAARARDATAAAAADARVLQVVPKSGALGSLKARMPKFGRAAGDGAAATGLPDHLAALRVSTDVEAHEPAPLSALVATLAAMRAGGRLLRPAEWAAYAAAAESGSVGERMAVAAEVAGCAAEAAFWRRLPATLATLRAALPASFTQPHPSEPALYTDAQTGISAYRRTSTDSRSDKAAGEPASEAADAASASGAAAGEGWQAELWSEGAQLREAAERVAWHERMAASGPQQPAAQQERRSLEYVCLGDYQTAVGFLLASSADRSARYYRDALCTIALAAAVAPEAAGGGGGGALPEASAAARSLHVQVAKVITANAAAAGDTLLGVPLLCSAGLHAEAVALLQDAGLWQLAATLAARALPRQRQAPALERWAAHVQQAEGRLWRALGVLTAAGALRNAALLLRAAGLPDCAAAFVEAAGAAGFGTQGAASDAGGLENWHHATAGALRQRSYSGSGEAGEGGGSVAQDFEQYCSDVLWHL